MSNDPLPSIMVPQNLQVLMHIGLALNTWSQVERTLTELFIEISTMDRRRAIAVFDGVISFEVRLSMLNRLILFESCDDLEREMWVRCSGRLAKGYKKRHELAHFSMLTNAQAEWGVSPFFNWDVAVEGNHKFLRTEQIAERHRKFVTLALAVGWFRDQARIRRGMPGKDLLSDSATLKFLAHIRELAVRTLQARQAQPREPSPKDNW